MTPLAVITFGKEIEFAYPGILKWCWVGIVIALLACWLQFWLDRRPEFYANPKNLYRTTKPPSQLAFISVMILWQMYAFWLIVTLAFPYDKNGQYSFETGDKNIALTFDASISSAAEDYRGVMKTKDGAPPIGPWGSRIDMAKDFSIKNILQAMPGNKIGLITYAGEGWSQAPLCEDYSTLQYIMTENGWMDTLSAPGDGSDYLAGLQVAIDTLRRDFDPQRKQVIIMFSDGGKSVFKSKKKEAEWQERLAKCINEVEALRKSCNGNFQLLIIGLGSLQGQQIPIYDETTGARIDYFPPGKKDNKAVTRLDKEVLEDLARVMGGRYLWLSPEDGKLYDGYGISGLSVDWAHAIGPSKKVVEGIHLLTSYPLAIAMSVLVLLLTRALWRSSDNKPRSLPR